MTFRIIRPLAFFHRVRPAPRVACHGNRALSTLTPPVAIPRSLGVFAPLQKHAPTIYARGNDITPLYEPHAFYAELKVEQRKKKQREGICPVTLYIVAHFVRQATRVYRCAVHWARRARACGDIAHGAAAIRPAAGAHSDGLSARHARLKRQELRHAAAITDRRVPVSSPGVAVSHTGLDGHAEKDLAAAVQRRHWPDASQDLRL